MIGVPSEIEACPFDLDGVLTQTAKVHAVAWKQMFDAYLRRRADSRGEQFLEFDEHRDYDEYVDGKARYERAGGFRVVVGVDRVGQSAAGPRHGADLVESHLAELLDARHE